MVKLSDVEVFTARERKPPQLGRVIASIKLAPVVPMTETASFTFALPGVTQDEAVQFANELSENFKDRVRYVAAQDRNDLIRSVSMVLNHTVWEHYDLRGVSKKGWSKKSISTAINDYSYELRSVWPARVALSKFETLDVAMVSDRVLRFLYPNERGVLVTRRVEVTSWIVKPWGLCFNGRRFDYDGVQRFRTYQLEKMERPQVETLPVKHLAPTIALELQLSGSLLTIAFHNPRASVIDGYASA